MSAFPSISTDAKAISSKQSPQVALADCVPAVQQSLFVSSIIIALLAMTAMGGTDSRSYLSSLPGWLESASRWLDPALLQLISAFLVTVVVMRFRYPGDPMLFNIRRRYISLTATFALVVLPLVAIFLMERYWLKPGFGYDRPTSFREDSYLLKSLGWTFESRASCPSGFALRQTWLVLIGFSFAVSSSPSQPTVYYSNWNRGSVAVLCALLILTALISIVRMVQQALTPFDVAMGIGVGTYIFWLSYYILARLRGTEGQNFGTDIFAASCIFLPFFIFYSRDIVRLGLPPIILLIAAGFTHKLYPLYRWAIARRGSFIRLMKLWTKSSER